MTTAPIAPLRSTTSQPAPGAVTRREIRLHGQHVSYLEAGRPGAPVVVMLHGLASNAATWESVMPQLAQHVHVIAPDLLGHGESAKPRSGDYTLGGHATGVRDLMVALGVERATVAGHSFGGGVTMQFAHQFPEFTERVVLVASGGLGQGVNLALRAATLPGAAAALHLATALIPRRLISLLDAGASTAPGGVAAELRGLFTAVDSFTDSGARAAFVQTVRGALNLSGQRITGSERLHLFAEIPVLLVAGTNDTVIPVEHTVTAHDSMPGSLLDVFDGAGHFPHVDEPDRFAALLQGFLERTEPARADVAALRRRLLHATGGEPVAG